MENSSLWNIRNKIPPVKTKSAKYMIVLECHWPNAAFFCPGDFTGGGRYKNHKY